MTFRALHSLPTAFQGLPHAEMFREFVAPGTELEGFLHLLEHLLVVAEQESFSLSLHGSPSENETVNIC